MLDTARKTLDLFTSSERWMILGLFAAAVVTGLLETFAVASIMPFMAVVADPGMVDQNAWLGRLSELLGAETRSGFLAVLAVLALGALLLAHAASISTTWAVQRFVWTKHNEVTSRLLRRYLSRPYAYFLDENSARISKSLLADAATVFRGVLTPFLDVGVKSVVALCILGFLLFLDPVVALASAVLLGGAYGFLWTSIREGQATIGREQVTYNTGRYKIAGESLAGVKELKVLGREDAMVRRFERVSRRYSDTTVSFELAARIPRNVMEVMAYGGILVLVVYVLVTRETLGQTLPLISAFAFAGYKLMPSLQGIFAGLHQVKFNAAALDDLYRDLFEGAVETRGEGKQGSAAQAAAATRVPDGRWSGAPSLERSLELERVTFHYPGAERPALRDVSLQVPAGTRMGIVGSTGSGKTTLVDLVIGLIQPSSGSVVVDGVELTPELLLDWRTRVGYVPQEIFLTDESIAANIALGLEPDEISRERVEWAATVAQIDSFVQELPAGYDTEVGERGVRLSGGQRQRIGIARALYGRSRLLVLDEATSALDTVTEAALLEGLKALSPPPTVLAVAHRIESVRDADRIVVLEEGRVAASGCYEELVVESEVFQAFANDRSGSTAS